MKLLRILPFTVVVALASCASQPRPSSIEDVAVSQRAVERWQHLIGGRADLAWDYLTPGVRSTKTRERYAEEMSDRPVKWKAVRFKSEDCTTETTCTVTLEVEYTVRMPVTGVGDVTVPADVNERWLRIDGQWFHLPADFEQGGLR
jgi:hypothetical protein